ncbi:MAG: penicillin-binding protein 2, partial [Acetobacteraceae bacterium]
MAKAAARIIFLEAVLVLAASAVVARSFWLQVVHYGVWEKKAGDRRELNRVTNARRGRILDRNGQPLAVSQEQYRFTVSPNEVKDLAALRAELPSVLGVTKGRVDQAFTKDYPYFQGPFDAEQIGPLRSLRGIHLEVLYNRVYPMPGLAPRILGRLGGENGDVGIEGIEKAMDTLLRGRPGESHYLVDARGTRLPAPGPAIVEPIAGRDVELTIDADLQGIAEGALRRTIEEHQAHGGEIVIMDVHTGELYAVASLGTDSATGNIVPTASALLAANEPGSTSKLFTAAAMLRFNADTSPVDGEGGIWRLMSGGRTLRTVKDVEPIHGPVSLAEAIKVSSNIAMSKFSLRLQPEQQFTTMRNFGFGTPPGTGFPGEERGVLMRPAKWVNDLLSKTSLAMGYQWEATAVQLAAGYGAMGNHGTLMTPTLVRRVRDAAGAITWEHRPDTVRQAVPDSIAAHLLEYLRLTEDSGGTGVKAQLTRYKMAGKTGTAQRTARDGYRGSYAGLFPDRNPQVVIYVMIDRVRAGSIYGGNTAAPLGREVMEEALAAQTSPLDRSLLTAAVPLPAPAGPRVATAPSTRRVRIPAPPVPGVRGLGT